MKKKLVKRIFKNSDSTSKKTQRVSIRKSNWLMLFKEIIAVYSENQRKPINALCRQNAVLRVLIAKSDGTYNYHSVLKC
jgi:hypothetical protein